MFSSVGLFLPITSNSLSLRCFGAQGVEFWRKNAEMRDDLPLMGALSVTFSGILMPTFLFGCHGSGTFVAASLTVTLMVIFYDILVRFLWICVRFCVFVIILLFYIYI